MKNTYLESLLEAQRIIKNAPWYIPVKAREGQPGPRQKPVEVPENSVEVRLDIINILTGRFSGKECPPWTRVRHEYLLAVIKMCDGSIAEAARRLGTDRRILQRMLNKRVETRRRK